MDQRIKQSGSEPTYILQIYMIFVNKDDKEKRRLASSFFFTYYLKGERNLYAFLKGVIMKEFVQVRYDLSYI